MKLSPSAICAGAVIGFLICCLLGRASADRNIYRNFLRLNPFLEQETSYFPTATQLAAVARAQCPKKDGKTLVIIGGNSVFNGSGQNHNLLWSRVLQEDLGGRYHVVNFSAPGAGIVDNGGVIFQMLAKEYPDALFVTNTEPGNYPPASRSSYSYLFWDAYYKGRLPQGAEQIAKIGIDDESAASTEFKLGRRLNSVLFFNDLWTEFSYRHFSTIWTSWLKNRSFLPRRRLPDWYDKRPPVISDVPTFEKMLPEHLALLRRRRCLAADRYEKDREGQLEQTAASLREDREQIAHLLPAPLTKRALVVLTPYNPWFLDHLEPDERERVAVSFHYGAELLQKEGFHALSTIGEDFEPTDFGDLIHLSPLGGDRLAHLVAKSIRQMDADLHASPAR